MKIEDDCFSIAFGPKLSSDDSKSTFESEMKRYTNAESIETNENPLLWWKNKQNEFPVIADIAKEFLNAPATSIASERVFSKAGAIINKKRASLSSKNANMLIFIAHNQKILNQLKLYLINQLIYFEICMLNYNEKNFLVVIRVFCFLS